MTVVTAPVQRSRVSVCKHFTFGIDMTEWGLVWLFQDFENADTNQVPQILSDHPGNANRVKALERHFKENPSVFGVQLRREVSLTDFGSRRMLPKFLCAEARRGSSSNRTRKEIPIENE